MLFQTEISVNTVYLSPRLGKRIRIFIEGGLSTRKLKGEWKHRLVDYVIGRNMITGEWSGWIGEHAEEYFTGERKTVRGLTKEEIDIIFEQLKEAGYGWVFDIPLKCGIH